MAALETSLESMALTGPDTQQSGSSTSTSKPFDAQAVLSAFQDDDDDGKHNQDDVRRRRALAALTISQQIQVPGAVARQLEPVLRSAFHTTQHADSHAAVRLLTTLYAIAPQEAHELLFGSYNLHTVIFPQISSTSSSTWDILRAELVASATGHSPSRTAIKSSSEGDHANALHAFLSVAAKSSDGTLALIAQLARYKLFRGPSENEQVGLAGAGAGAGASASAPNHQTISDADEADLLAHAKTQITSTSTTSAQSDEKTHAVLLLALEALGYLSTIPPIKQLIASDGVFLTRLCSLPQQHTPKKQVFPARGGPGDSSAQTQSTQSTYDVKSAIPPASASTSAPGTPLYYAICVILLHLVSLPETLSSEQKQLRKLKNLANASTTDSPPDPLESIDAINTRSDAVIDAGGVKFLVQSVSASNTSFALRQTLGQVFLALTTKQDRTRRGKIAQDGGGKALLALSVMVVRQEKETAAADKHKSPLARSNNDGSSAAADSSTLAPLQALAHLCITTSPAILFTNPTLPLSSLVTLYLHASATPLQRFEALLALTNLLSLDVDIAARVMSASSGSGSGSGSGSSSSGNDGGTATMTVAEAMESSILLDDNALVRRAAVELLCNALSANVSSVVDHWGGTEAGTRLHLLVALCGETSVQLKMAAAACVALLCSAREEACELVLALQVTTLRIVAELVKSAAGSGSGSTAKIVELDSEDDEQQQQQGHEETSQVDALGLSLRGLTLVSALHDYTRRTKADTDAKKLETSGIMAAVKDVYSDVVADLRVFLSSHGGKVTSQVDAQVRELQRQVVELARDILS